MSEQNPFSNNSGQPLYPESGAWAPPADTPQWAPPATANVPPPPTQPPAGAPVPPPPTNGFNPTPAPRSTNRSQPFAGRSVGRRGGIRGNGVYSIFAGIISIAVALGSLFIEGNGHFTFLIFLPVLGLIYGIVSIAQGRRRVLGIIGTVLCAVALLLELFLLI